MSWSSLPSSFGPPRGGAPTPDTGVSPSNAILRAGEFARYLSRLRLSRGETFLGLDETTLTDQARMVIARPPMLETRDDILPGLRHAKADTHLIVAAGDLSGQFCGSEVTSLISQFADVAVAAALRSATMRAAEKGWIDWSDANDPAPGLFVFALGKHGASELNYSSDIDLVVFYDADRFPASGREPGDAASRIVRDMTQILEERTVEGYVFRTDLRLRPDPRSTSLAVSTQAAELYYEGFGQNWERMVWIKGRPIAGDIPGAEAFLEVLQPFVWRRHLDYWALNDIHAIKRQIHAEGGHGELSDPAVDVKLGRGGIREIEFFAQTQQLILGGREPGLRKRRTDDGLRALADLGAISPEVCTGLIEAYGYLRGVEHRIQMLNDEQTHRLHPDPDQRDRVAALAGYDSLSAFDQRVRTIREYVHTTYSQLFAREERLSGTSGNLVFTGVDDDPGTVETLADMGFASPTNVIDRFRTWHRGVIRATRTVRGRQLLTAVTPQLLEVMGKTGEPDTAFVAFTRFLEGLPSGIQTLSLLLANPDLAEALIRTLTLSPKLAARLANRPDTLDAMLDGGFAGDLEGDPCGFISDIRSAAEAEGFEVSLNKARRSYRDEAFRIGFQLLQGLAPVDEAARAYTRLAEACVETLALVALREVFRKHGDSPCSWAVCAFGKFGSSELTDGSDLDLIVVYDGDGSGDRTFFTRFTQRLVTALSAPTEEGLLYEVDMQLRPSGRAGPVAVQKTAFDHYYDHEAWTWELMALTRFRPVTGQGALREDLADIVRGKLCRRREPDELLKHVQDMRQRIARDRPARTFWDLKLWPGGLVDLEFLAQWVQLRFAADRPEILSVRTTEALAKAGAAGAFLEQETNVLRSALALQSALQHIQRIALNTSDQLIPNSLALQEALARVAGARSFEELEPRLQFEQGLVSEIREKYLGPIATE